MNSVYPIYTIAEARAAEAALLKTEDEQADAVLDAGKNIGFRLLDCYVELKSWSYEPHVVVLLGKGNNAADALVALQVMDAALDEMRVSAVFVEGSDSLNSIGKSCLETLREDLGERLSEYTADEWLAAEDEPAELLVDAIYGAGFRPPLNAAAASIIAKAIANSAIEVRVAIDVPSGLSDAGMESGCFNADFTLVPGLPKDPPFNTAHAAAVGRVRFVESAPFTTAALPAASSNRSVVSPDFFKRINRLRNSQSDKRDYGHCLVLAGSPQMPGAALMASQAAVTSGAGLVTTLTPANVAHRIAGHCPETMWRPLPMTDDGGLATDSVRLITSVATRADAILIGPGLQMDRTSLFTLCRVVRETGLPMILDASVLVPDVLTAIMARPKQAGKVIVTPHMGEFERLVGPAYSGSVEENLLNFSKRCQLVTVLKGPMTRISDGENIWISSAGGPVLARGGSGDILSGMMLARFAAQPDNPMQAAAEAVTWHAAAADLLAAEQGAIAVRSSNLLDYLSLALRS